MATSFNKCEVKNFGQTCLCSIHVKTCRFGQTWCFLLSDRLMPGQSPPALDRNHKVSTQSPGSHVNCCEDFHEFQGRPPNIPQPPQLVSSCTPRSFGCLQPSSDSVASPLEHHAFFELLRGASGRELRPSGASGRHSVGDWSAATSRIDPNGCFPHGGPSTDVGYQRPVKSKGNHSP